MRIGSTVPRSFYNGLRAGSAQVRQRLPCVAFWETLLPQGMTTKEANRVGGTQPGGGSVASHAVTVAQATGNAGAGRVGGAALEAQAGAAAHPKLGVGPTGTAL